MDQGLSFRSIPAALGLAWVGILAHDLLEFGRPALEGSGAFLVLGLLLFALWRWRAEHRRRIAGLTLIYGLIGLVGAVTSVLPLAVWPFEPEQSLGHYLSHAIWIVAQIPLLWVALTCVRERRSTERDSEAATS